MEYDCICVGCGKKLREIFMGFWACDNAHVYQTEIRGIGDDLHWYPSDEPMASMVIEIDRLRASRAATEADLEDVRQIVDELERLGADMYGYKNDRLSSKARAPPEDPVVAVRTANIGNISTIIRHCFTLIRRGILGQWPSAGEENQ